MAGDLYEFIATKNSSFVKFVDANKTVAGLFMKLVKLLVSISEANRIAAEELSYEVFCPKGGDVIVIRLRHPRKSLTV